MEEYTKVTKQMTIEESEDIITGESFEYDENAHPRSIMMIRKSNGVPCPFFVESIIKILTIGNGNNPFTRRPLSQLTRERAMLFSRCIKEFPNYKILPGSSIDLFNRWIASYRPDCSLSPREKSLLLLEAQCFLQAEDLLDIFQSFNGSGSLDNRSEAENFLKNTGKTWILRHSSLQDSEYNKAYALTRLSLNGNYIHDAIVHRIGEGFFIGLTLKRGDNVNSNFSFSAEYPSIIHLLCAEVTQLTGR